MEKFLKEISKMNCKNTLSYHLIILVYTLDNIDLSSNTGYYSRGFIFACLILTYINIAILVKILE
nr:hypothetical protein [Borreliella californiensis]WKC91251.1 hypothetical protein QIA17_00145 [Borreliella californiensis]WNY70911.1 hypothetical protein QIA39_04395 [Borreliella californiensis]